MSYVTSGQSGLPFFACCAHDFRFLGSNHAMNAIRVQTKRDIEAILDSIDARPRKQFGQHFLIDGNLMRKLVESAELSPEDVVLEVGPGTGGLTDLLVEQVDRAICVEIDRSFQEHLARRFLKRDGFHLIRGDVLESKHRISGEVQKALEMIPFSQNKDSGAIKLVANLPYQIATPLILNLLIDYPQVRRMCFTVQAEVGARITAVPNTKAFGPLAILSQIMGRVSHVAKVPPAAFWPKPAVDSAMMRIDVQDSPFDKLEDLRSFSKLIRGAFDHRRKTLRSGLRYILTDEDVKRICDAVDASRRPESFGIDEWLSIHRMASQ